MMKIVIDIPEKLVCEGFESPFTEKEKDILIKAIGNGTPLPKGHGRLIDESKIKKCGWNFIDHHAKTDAPTIIEADREEEQ